jgi:lipopolysaccharide export system protein LptA
MPPGRKASAGAVALSVVLAVSVAAEPAREQPADRAPFDVGSVGHSKEPITITSELLEYDYKANVVVYRGEVEAVQGNVKVHSDKLTVTLARTGDGRAAKARVPDPGTKDSPNVQEVVAAGTVRIDQGTRWATGGKAVFDQSQRTLVLTENPVLHDGPNEVAGDRVVVYLDEDRSVVEGGRKRVKAVLYPSKENGLTPAGNAAGATRAEARQ